MRYINILFIAVLLLGTSLQSHSQTNSFSYTSPQEFCIKGVTVSGIQFLNPSVLISISGLTLGDTISVPGEDITNAIRKLWEQNLFSDVKITAARIDGDDIYLDIFLQELPRISAIEFQGVRKGQVKELQELINLRVGGQATESIISNSIRLIKNHYRGKGFLNTQVEVYQVNDTVMANGVRLTFNINRNERVRIEDITFEGNQAFTDRRLRRAMKNTKRRDLNIFKSSKLVEKDYREDKVKLIDFYNNNGYKDARIISDSIFVINPKRIGIHFVIEEGPQYFYRNIQWVGNTKLTEDELNLILGIEPGEVYDKSLLDKRLFVDENSISTTYMDQGYLFFNLEPIETRVENDSVDILMRIIEGEPATINRVIITGNTKTHENVIRRELFSKPGDLFSKTNITRSIRELANLGHFDPEKLDIRPLPNPADGTVDLRYVVEEKANDQLEISGGWGAGMFVGTLGVRFSNFSASRMFERKAWRPVPSGDSQTLSLRAQTNGSHYRAFSMNFVEPWLGGQKPTNLSVSLYHTIRDDREAFYQRSNRYMKVTGGGIGLGTRLKVPDDFFTIYSELSYQNYNLMNWYGFLISTGMSNNLSIKTSLSRNSVDQLIYPRRGSNLSLTLQLTPPYSLLNNKDYTTLSIVEKYRWIEYHKWSGRVQWYNALIENLVLYTNAQFGYLGYYNSEVGYSPFEGFTLGGDGMSGYNLYGSETIGLRGYSNGSLTPIAANNVRMANIYQKFTVELRYPITLQPQAAIYLLTFLEAGNSWYEFSSFKPFNIHRSAGAGIRLFLPMIGMLGVDWGYGFDEIPHNPEAHKSQFHFVIGMPF